MVLVLMREVNWLKLRIYTINNYLDIETKDSISIDILTTQLDEGTTIMLETVDGNIFILNNINVLAIEVTPPIQNKNANNK